MLDKGTKISVSDVNTEEVLFEFDGEIPELNNDDIIIMKPWPKTIDIEYYDIEDVEEYDDDAEQEDIEDEYEYSDVVSIPLLKIIPMDEIENMTEGNNERRN